MKKLMTLSAIASSLLLVHSAHAATINRDVNQYYRSGDKAATLKIQFSGGCSGSATYKEKLGLRFQQTFETDNSGNIVANSMQQLLFVTQENNLRNSSDGDRVLFSTGRFSDDSYPTKLPLTDPSESITETLKKDVLKLRYINKDPGVIIRQFNFYDDNLSDGPTNDIAGLKKCLADYNQLGILQAHEVTYPRFNNSTDFNSYLVNSAKKTNIKADFTFRKNPNTGYYVNHQSTNFKAVISGVLLPKSGNKCSGNFSKWPRKTTCKALPPIKYKVTMTIKD